MSFELRIDEALPDGIHRIAEKVRECVDGSSKASRDEMVHEARKGLKKLRALVRLVRPGVGGKLYRRENIAFRDISRPLTEVRDAKILVEALDRTTGGDGSRPGPGSFCEGAEGTGPPPAGDPGKGAWR